MCKVGGPRCDDADLSKEDLHKLNLKRITDAEAKIAEYGADDPRSDVWRSARYRAEVATRGGGEKIGESGDVYDQIWDPENGGATYSPKTGTAPRFGFGYSVYPDRSKVVDIQEFASDRKTFMRNMMEYQWKNADALEKSGNWVGLWHDGETGKLYIDISKVCATAENARKQCLAHDQIAYYDFQSAYNKGEEGSVYVNRDAKSGQS